MKISLAAVALVLLFAPASAPASLRSYELTVAPKKLEDLALAGFDVTEGVRGNHVTVAATGRQRRVLTKLGFKPRLQRSRVAADFGPTGGYDVWRPYARPAYDAQGARVPNLVEEMKALAKAHPRIVKLERIGMTGGGPDDPATTGDDGFNGPKPIYAVKITRNARKLKDGAKPSVLYSSTQHAREWLSAETNRRLMKLFIDNYGRSGPVKGAGDVTAEELTDLVNTRELWFVLVCNPDGYDYTFSSPGTRLWRKNLRDNNDDGVLSSVDGVDPNRNFATHWGLDNEGSSDDIASETFRGTAPTSEPETKALDGLMRRVHFAFNNNFHTFGPLLLYPFGWQVDTFAADDPIFRAMSGSDERPAIEGFNPGVGAELYVTNGDTNDHAYTRYDTLSWTPELNGGDDSKEEGAGGFVFQDVEADVQEQFELQLPFSLDMASSADDPADPVSHLGNSAPAFDVDTFDVSYGDPQTVQVSARRRLGAVTLHWRAGDGPVRSAPTSEWRGGSRYGGAGDVYYHRVRGQVTGASPGDKVRVWFSARGRSSKRFTYTLARDSGAPVLILADENYSGPVPEYEDPTAPAYLGDYRAALKALGVRYDVWDVDARGLEAPDALGVLSHYSAVVWYTGDDDVTRFPDQPGQTGAAKVANDIVLAVRDRLNEGGKLVLTGSLSADQFFTAYEYAQFGEPVKTDTGYCTADPDAVEGCIPLSNDFFQYWLGGYVYVAGGGSGEDAAFPVKGTGAFGGLDFDFAADGNQAGAASTALVTSSVLDPKRYPAFKHTKGLAEYDRPGASPYDPFTGEWYAYSGMSDLAYRRLSRTVDLTGKAGGALDFQASIDTEPGYDFAFVEAHHPGQDDWTTLPLTDDGGQEVTSADTGSSCSGDDATWQEEHPFLAHYQTVVDPSKSFADGGCTSTGTTGTWHALTGNSGGWQHLKADLSAYDGGPVEVSVTYVQDPASAGLGVFVDDLRTSAGGAALSETSFETDLGGWDVAGPPEGTENNSSDWTRLQSAFDESPVIATPRSVWFTFGLEGIDTAAHRKAVLGKALSRLGVTAPPPVRHRLRVRGGTVRAHAAGNVPIRVRCDHLGGRRCRGSAFLFRGRKAVAKRAFAVPMNRWAKRPLRLQPAAFDALRERGRLRLTLRVRAFNQRHGRFARRVKVTVLAPG